MGDMWIWGMGMRKGGWIRDLGNGYGIGAYGDTGIWGEGIGDRDRFRIG